MYLHDAFNVTDPAEARAMLAAARLGCLVTHDPQGLFATHIPFVFDPEAGVLRGHLARENEHWRRGDGAALVVFQGIEAYVSPSWFPSKQAHGRVVPTWNYEIVHVYGSLAWHEDRDWLRAQIGALTHRFEDARPNPWRVEDAPADHIERLLGGIVGVEIAIDRIEAKRKLSQNRSDADRLGAADGLAASDDPRDRLTGEAMRHAPD